MSGPIPQVPPQEAEAARRAGAVIVDVREEDELRAAQVPETLCIPMSQFQQRIGEVPRDRTIIVMCAAGARSQAVAGFLRQQGWTDVRNLAGGIYAWHQAGLPVTMS